MSYLAALMFIFMCACIGSRVSLVICILFAYCVGLVVGVRGAQQ